MTWAYRELQRNKGGGVYRGLQGVRRGYRGLQGGRRGYRGLQGVTRGLQRVPTGYRGDKALQWVKKYYRNFFLTRTFPDTFSWSILHKNQS